jgi:hypothetical protein
MSCINSGKQRSRVSRDSEIINNLNSTLWLLLVSAVEQHRVQFSLQYDVTSNPCQTLYSAEVITVLFLTR